MRRRDAASVAAKNPWSGNPRLAPGSRGDAPTELVCFALALALLALLFRIFISIW
jgi:hypothetical protein